MCRPCHRLRFDGAGDAEQCLLQVGGEGFGPGGLQATYFLRRLGIDCALLSADEGPGGMFRRFPLFERLISWTHDAEMQDAMWTAVSPQLFTWLMSSSSRHMRLIFSATARPLSILDSTAALMILAPRLERMLQLAPYLTRVRISLTRPE